MAVKQQVAPDRPFGVGLRLSAPAAAECAQPAALDDLRALLARHGLYVFTINAFPYGPFHGTPVKEAVYRPDWLEPERRRYTETWPRCCRRLLEAAAGRHRRARSARCPAVFGRGRRSPTRRRRWRGRLAAQAARAVAPARGRRPADRRWRSSPSPSACWRPAADGLRFLQQHLSPGRVWPGFAAATGLAAGRRRGGPAPPRRPVPGRLPRGGRVRGRRGGAGGPGGRRSDCPQAAGQRRPAHPRPRPRTSWPRSQRFAEGVYLHQVVIRRGEQSDAGAGPAPSAGHRRSRRPRRRVAHPLPRAACSARRWDRSKAPSRSWPTCWRQPAHPVHPPPGGRDLHLGRPARRSTGANRWPMRSPASCDGCWTGWASDDRERPRIRPPFHPAHRPAPRAGLERAHGLDQRGRRHGPGGRRLLPHALLVVLGLAVSLFYVGGMYLNDAFDAGWERQHRPERPIPAGQVHAQDGVPGGVRHAGRRGPAGGRWQPTSGPPFWAALVLAA